MGVDHALARSFGAAPGKTIPFDASGEHPLQVAMARNVIRHAEQAPILEAAGFQRRVYVGAGGIESETCRKEMYAVPVGVGVQPYVRDVEDALMVLEGNLIVGWEENGETVEMELGPRDLVFNPAGRAHWFRNAGVGPCTAWVVVGDAGTERVRFVGR